MTITVNGQAVDLEEDAEHTLSGLLRERGLKEDRVAVERNGDIVSRPLWSQTMLRPGDRLEIVHFVGGGGHERR